MEPAGDFLIAYVTAPDIEIARRIVRPLLEQHLAACANIIPGIESHFWWQGKIDQANEVLILFKVAKPAVSKFEAEVLKVHPYDTPEIVTVTLTFSTPKYIDWLRTNSGTL